MRYNNENYMPTPQKKLNKKDDLEFAADLLGAKTDQQLNEYGREFKGDVRPKFEIFPGE